MKLTECKRGHDTTDPDARYKNGACRACHREVHLRKYRDSEQGKRARARPVWARLERLRREREGSG